MKKRILSMILMLAMVMGIFTGCGAGADNAGASMEKITVSEMLANVVEENDGKVVIFVHDSDSYKENFSEKTKWFAYTYNGEATQLLRGANGEVNTPTADLASVDASNKRTELKEYYNEHARVKIDMSRPDSSVVFLGGNDIFFGECKHVDINGESYMFFKSYKISKNSEEFGQTMFTLIKDTDFTKDKLIVADSTGESDINLSIMYVSKLTDVDKETFGIK